MELDRIGIDPTDLVMNSTAETPRDCAIARVEVRDLGRLLAGLEGLVFRLHLRDAPALLLESRTPHRAGVPAPIPHRLRINRLQ